MLTCEGSRTSEASTEVWNLLFSKTTMVLEHTLDLLSNMVTAITL